MCWCRPEVRTPCCGTKECHAAQVRETGNDAPCPWCAKDVVAIAGGPAADVELDSPNHVPERSARLAAKDARIAELEAKLAEVESHRGGERLVRDQYIAALGETGDALVDMQRARAAAEAKAVELETELATVRANAERLRPIVYAAIAWAKTSHDSPEEHEAHIVLMREADALGAFRGES